MPHRDDATTRQEHVRRPETSLFVHLVDSHGHPEFSRQDDVAERNIQIYHGQLSILSHKHATLAELASAQSLLQRLFYQNPAPARQAGKGQLLGPTPYVRGNVRKWQLFAQTKTVQDAAVREVASRRSESNGTCFRDARSTDETACCSHRTLASRGVPRLGNAELVTHNHTDFKQQGHSLAQATVYYRQHTIQQLQAKYISPRCYGQITWSHVPVRRGHSRIDLCATSTNVFRNWTHQTDPRAFCILYSSGHSAASTGEGNEPAMSVCSSLCPARHGHEMHLSALDDVVTWLDSVERCASAVISAKADQYRLSPSAGFIAVTSATKSER